LEFSKTFFQVQVCISTYVAAAIGNPFPLRTCLRMQPDCGGIFFFCSSKECVVAAKDVWMGVVGRHGWNNAGENP
jgi:hypothetical protein